VTTIWQHWSPTSVQGAPETSWWHRPIAS